MAICNNIIIYAYHDGLNDSGPYRLIVFDTQKLEKWGCMALLKELCRWELGLLRF